MKLFFLAFQLFLSGAFAELELTTINQGSGYAEFNNCVAPTKKFTYDYVILGLGLSSTYYDTICGYPPATGTFLLCTYKISGNSTKLQNKVFGDMAKTCDGYSSYNYSEAYYKEQYINATQYYIPLSEVNVSDYLYRPTLPNITATIENTYRNAKGNNFSTDTGTWFGVGLYGFFLLLILVSSIYNFFRYIGITKTINNWKISKLIQKYIIYPPVFPNGKFVQPVGFKYLSMLFPNRIEFLVDTFLFGLHVAYFCVPYRAHIDGAWKRFVALRSGISAIAHIPLFILFAGRNNFLLYITGWSYSTFLHFHKVLAGWMFVDAITHSVAYTIDYLGYYVESLREVKWFAAGVAAMVLCGCLILHSFHMFRTFSYEIFLVLHVCMALAFIVLLWYHVRVMGWMEWMVASCCVWFFDRLVRVIRMSFFGFRKATITAVGDNLIKVEVAKPSWFYHTPGTFGFIYFGGILFWENNPFTMSVHNGNICAFIRVKKGVTHRLWKKLAANNNQLVQRVCIEGPYGGMNYAKFRRCEDSLLMTGGSGAPGILEAAAGVRTGKLVWVVQNLQFVTCYQDLVNKVTIPIDVYVTQETSANKTCTLKELLSESDSDAKSTESSDKVSDEKVESSAAQISIRFVRPDANEIINSYINESSASSVGILACGPPRMMDHIRNVVSENITNWDKSVDFFDEFQVW